MDKRLDLDALLPESDTLGLTWQGKFHAYANRYSWSILQRRKFEQLFDRINTLELMDEPGDVDAAEHEAKLQELVAMLVPSMEREAIDALTVEALGLVLVDFLAKYPGQIAGLALLRKAQAEVEKATETKPIGAPSSPRSRRTTAGLPRKRG